MSVIVVGSEYTRAVQTIANTVESLRFLRNTYDETISDIEASAINSEAARAALEGLRGQALAAIDKALATVEPLSDAIDTFLDTVETTDNLTF